MSNAKPQVGDKVRLRSYEGEVIRELLGDITFVDANGIETTVPGRDVQVIEKRRPKVGDVIEDRLGLAKLPDGAVVRNALGRPLIIRPHGTINREGRFTPFYAFGRSPYLGGGSYTVVSLPES